MKLSLTIMAFMGVTFSYAQSKPTALSPFEPSTKTYLQQMENQFVGKEKILELIQMVSPPEKDPSRSDVTKMALDSVVSLSKNTNGNFEFTSKMVYHYGYNEEMLSKVNLSENTNGNLDTTEASFYTYDAFNYLAMQEYHNNPFGTGLKKLWKSEFAYNANHHLTEQTNAFWDVNSAGGNWINDLKQSWTYNSKNELVKYEVLDWDTVNLSWKIRTREVYNYDAFGNEIEREVWDSYSGTFKLKMKLVMTFDANNKVVETVGSLNNSTSVVWDSQFRSQYTYANDLLLSEVYSKNNGVGTPWELDAKNEHTFENGNHTEILNYSYKNGAWFGIGNYKAKFNAQNDNIEQIQFLRIYPDTNWIANFKTTYEYNYVDDVRTETFYEYSSVSQQLEPERKFTYDKDELGNVEVSLFQYWDQQSNSWGGSQSSSITSTYDNNYSKSELVKSPYQYMYSLKLSEVISSWNDSANLMLAHLKREYHWSPIVVNSVEKPLVLNGKVFPNPVSEVLNVEVNKEGVEFQLFDVQGKLILRKTVNETSLIETRQLPPGVYIYILTSGDQVQQGKLVKE